MSTDTIQLGSARVHLLELGPLLADLADWLRVPPAEWPPAAVAFLERPITVPALATLIELPGTLVLLDPCDPRSIVESEYAIPGRAAALDLGAQLAGLGLAPEQVGHVVITHMHFDHYSGVVRDAGGAPALAFPRARHYVGRADWEARRALLADPGSLEARTLGAIERAGLLELVDGERDLGGGVSVLPAAGETPGHQIVRLRAGGQSLYCLGDLYHHPIEIERPEWLVSWADPAATRASRARLVAAALADDALLSAGHIAGFGRLRRAGAGVRWDAI